MDAKAQVCFAELLRYFQRGTFATFTRAAELAFGTTAVEEPYFVANLLFASQLSGLCETGTATGTIHWWVAHDGDVRINSRSAKIVSATDFWLTASNVRPSALITDERNRPLILGSRIDQEASAPPSIFDNQLSDILPRFSSVEEQLCRTVSMGDALGGPIDVFTPSIGRWEAADTSALEGPVMFRVRGPFSGFSYYLQHTRLSLRFQILQPEWAFVAAIHLLPWQLRTLVELSASTVCIPRSVRLPLPIYRSLFASAETVCIGTVVRFLGVRDDCIAGITHYFDKTETHL